jgi:hypothetical protein
MEATWEREAAERQAGWRTEGPRARRRNGNDLSLRCFLIKLRSSPAKSELGQEVTSEGEALSEACRNRQRFHTVTAWKAVPEVNGTNPAIVKQAVATKTTENFERDQQEQF